MLISYFCLFAGLVYSASGHSWLACSDYAEKDAADWAPLKCRGFPRHSARYAPKNRFGIDTGMFSSLHQCIYEKNMISYYM